VHVCVCVHVREGWSNSQPLRQLAELYSGSGVQFLRWLVPDQAKTCVCVCVCVCMCVCVHSSRALFQNCRYHSGPKGSTNACTVL